MWDTGIGIAAAEQQRVYDEFYQIRNPERNRRRGIGLGLAIVKRTCELLGHAIRVESEPGRGSTFELELARCAPAPREPERGCIASVGRSTESLRGLVVVVVDDDAEVQKRPRARCWKAGLAGRSSVPAARKR